MEKANIYTLNKFSGINVSADKSQIADSESPDMMNFELDIEGALNKRTGYTKIFESVGSAAISGIYTYYKKDGTIIDIFSCGDKLYKLENDIPVLTYSGLNNSKVKFFTMKDKVYIMDGINYLEYDGTTVTSPIPYVPTLFRNGTAMEDFNLLGNRFKCIFSPDGTVKVFSLGVKGLDDTQVKVSIDGGTTWVTTGFTVDKAKGEVTFTAAPGQGVATLYIEAGFTDTKKQSLIKNCTLRVFFGGVSDTRVLTSGNSEYPNRVWRSGLYDPTYFPENAYTDVGPDNEKIMNFSKQYSSLVILKERSIYLANLDVEKGILQTKLINEEFGCNASNSVQLVDNKPIWIDSRKGVCTLVQSNIVDERNVKMISQNINRMLLNEPNLSTAITCDYNNKYMIFLNDKVYLFDYFRNVWYLWDNINATSLQVKNTLYFGDSNGCINRFKDKSEEFAYNDNGQPINAYWYSKLLNFGKDYREKTIRRMFYAIIPADRTSVKLYALADDRQENLMVSERVDLQRFDPFFFEPISFIGNSLPLSDGIKSKVKKVVYFQVKIENNMLDESLGFLSISFEVQNTKYRK